MISKTDVQNIASELGGTVVTDATWTALIGFAYLQMNIDVWGTWLDMGATYLVAHLVTLGKRRGAGGPVQTEMVGQVSRSYFTMLTAGVLGSTSYGQEFFRLRNSLADARFPVIV